MSIFLHHDPDLRAGFPLKLGASGESSPALVDLDGHGTDEIMVATADGMVLALRGDGSPLPGWPVATNLARVGSGQPQEPSQGACLWRGWRRNRLPCLDRGFGRRR